MLSSSQNIFLLLGTIITLSQCHSNNFPVMAPSPFEGCKNSSALFYSLQYQPPQWILSQLTINSELPKKTQHVLAALQSQIHKNALSFENMFNNLDYYQNKENHDLLICFLVEPNNKQSDLEMKCSPRNEINEALFYLLRKKFLYTFEISADQFGSCNNRNVDIDDNLSIQVDGSQKTELFSNLSLCEELTLTMAQLTDAPDRDRFEHLTQMLTSGYCPKILEDAKIAPGDNHIKILIKFINVLLNLTFLDKYHTEDHRVQGASNTWFYPGLASKIDLKYILRKIQHFTRSPKEDENAYRDLFLTEYDDIPDIEHFETNAVVKDALFRKLESSFLRDEDRRAIGYFQLPDRYEAFLKRSIRSRNRGLKPKEEQWLEKYLEAKREFSQKNSFNIDLVKFTSQQIIENLHDFTMVSAAKKEMRALIRHFFVLDIYDLLGSNVPMSISLQEYVYTEEFWGVLEEFGKVDLLVYDKMLAVFRTIVRRNAGSPLANDVKRFVGYMYPQFSLNAESTLAFDKALMFAMTAGRKMISGLLLEQLDWEQEFTVHDIRQLTIEILRKIELPNDLRNYVRVHFNK